MSGTFQIRNKIAMDICNTYFGGSKSLKGKIIKDMAQLKQDYLLKLQGVLEDQHGYIFNAVNKKQEANGFNTPYGKFKYLYQIAGRLIKDAEYKAASPAQAELPAEERISWMNELTADSQPPKQKQEVVDSGIAEADLFDHDETKARLNEDQRRKNWEKAIAEHRQQHPLRVYAYDEMY